MAAATKTVRITSSLQIYSLDSNFFSFQLYLMHVGSSKILNKKEVKGMCGWEWYKRDYGIRSCFGFIFKISNTDAYSSLVPLFLVCPSIFFKMTDLLNYHNCFGYIEVAHKQKLLDGGEHSWEEYLSFHLTRKLWGRPWLENHILHVSVQAATKVKDTNLQTPVSHAHSNNVRLECDICVWILQPSDATFSSPFSFLMFSISNLTITRCNLPFPISFVTIVRNIYIQCQDSNNIRAA